MKKSRYNSGQLIIEYVLILAMSAVIAGVLANTMASRDPDNPGAIITGWSKVIQAIGADVVDECLRPGCN